MQNDRILRREPNGLETYDWTVDKESQPETKSISVSQEIDVPYSAFTTRQKSYITVLVAFAGMFSPLSSFIYYPAIGSIARGLQTTVELVNLTITSYMIVSGVVPSLIGNASDVLGRRPVYLFAIALYLCANVGLALQRSFPALLVLRMLQSAGSSGMSRPCAHLQCMSSNWGYQVL